MSYLTSQSKNFFATLRFRIITLCFLSVILWSSGLVLANQEKQIDFNVKVNPTISITISSSELLINNLSPGVAADSNSITIATDSNSLSGYTLTATVGSTTYDYTDFRNTSGDAFTVTAMTVQNNTDLASGSWGCTFSTDSGTSWSNYIGLPLYTTSGTTLLDISTASSAALEFKLGAKASPSQASGNYTNVINFILTAKVSGG